VRWATDLDVVLSIAATLLEIVSISFIPIVLVRKKEASSTAAWILLLLFVPLVGVVLFWFLGRDRVRIPARRKHRATVEVRERMRVPEGMLVHTALDTLLEKFPEPRRGVMRLASLVGRIGIARGNKIDVLVGAPATYDAIIEAIDRATDHVHAEFFILRADASGRRFRDALVRAAERGVRVRVLYDGFGSVGAGRLLAPLRAAGGRSASFLPLDPIRRAWTFNLRNHRKLVVIDGAVGFTGGINVGDEFLGWRDLFLRIAGPAVWKMQAIFVEDWSFAEGFELVDPAFSPAVQPQGDSVAQIVASGPDSTNENIHRLYFAAIASARERVWITTPYFVPDRAILMAIETAALRGVDVQLVLPRQNNHRLTGQAGRSFYDELLGAGVRIHEYLPSMLHTKTLIVDGDFATVGTANLDTRSFRLNFELIAVVYDKVVVDALERIFAIDRAQTEEVTLARWRQRPVTQRLMEGLGRLFAPLL